MEGICFIVGVALGVDLACYVIGCVLLNEVPSRYWGRRIWFIPMSGVYIVSKALTGNIPTEGVAE